MPFPRRIVVIGGGMAGLAAAEEIVALAAAAAAPVEITLVESAGRVGGVLSTVRRDGWLVERAADNFLAARPEAVQLVERLGLQDQLVGVDPRVRRALVWHDGRAVPAPQGFRLLAPGRIGPILSTPLLSPAGRLRLLAERFVPPRSTPGDESLESFVVRRLGREAFERLVQPLAAGIWTADPARLSMAAACGEFLAMEREQGSLWAGERRRARTVAAPSAAGARYGQFLTLASGMHTLPERLAARLREHGVRFIDATAAGIERPSGSGWHIAIAGPAEAGAAIDADAVVLAVPSPVAARLLASVEPAVAADLRGIEYAGSAVISLGFARTDVTHPLDAAGMVIPRRARRRILAVSFSSSKFPGRAPEGCVLMRVFAGGALDPDMVRRDDAALETIAREEVAELLGARGTPRLVQIDRWHGAMPQYHVGHVERVARIMERTAAVPGLGLAGAAYTGVGIPQVIASGQAAARQACRRPVTPRGPVTP
jgi:protoporphyrinogen/coproporphyrinogen III oxidase